MMQESRLTNFQQRQLDKAMKSGTSLPPSCHPTSSAKPRAPTQKKVTSKVLNPRNYSSRIRTKEQIESTGAYEREQFHPLPHTKYNGVYERDKQRLANLMAFGQDVEPATHSRPVRQVRQEEEEEEVDRFQELENEIAERRGFLREMERLGRGADYRTVIETEVSQMIREMEVIDAKRTAELQKVIASRNGASSGSSSANQHNGRSRSSRDNSHTT